MATVLQIANEICRVKNFSIAGGAEIWFVLAEWSGLLPEGTTVVFLPPGFRPRPYTRPDGTVVSLQDSIAVELTPDAGTVQEAVPIAIVKSGTTPEDFKITLTNVTVATLSSTLEAYVKFHQ
jgi:hypothetical protein